MLHINIICIGKLKEQYLKDALNEYSKRLSKYCSLKMIELPDEKLPDILNENIINKIHELSRDKSLFYFIFCLYATDKCGYAPKSFGRIVGSSLEGKRKQNGVICFETKRTRCFFPFEFSAESTLGQDERQPY